MCDFLENLSKIGNFDKILFHPLYAIPQNIFSTTMPKECSMHVPIKINSSVFISVASGGGMPNVARRNPKISVKNCCYLPGV